MHSLILKNISRFIQLTEEERAYFVSILKEKRLKKKQYLVQEGDITRFTYFVTEGCLRSYFIDPKGVEHNIQFAIEDWWTGDMHSFLTQTPAKLNIEALEDSILLGLEKNVQEDLFVKIPKFERFFRHLLQNAFVSFQERIVSNLSETAEERYIKFRNKYPSMYTRVPQKQVASFLGITPESLSRVRKQLTTKR